MPELLFLFPVIALITGYVARTRGRSFWGWFALSCVLPIIAFAILLFLRDKHTSDEKGVS